jgi:hypothetical protein
MKPAFQAPEPAAAAPAPVREVAAPTVASPPIAPAKPAPAPAASSGRSDNYYQVKATIFGALIEAIDLAQLAKLDGESAREEIRDIVNEIIAIKNIVMSIAEQEELLDDICNDVLGYGPLEPLLSRDDIADIMVNGAGTVFIEVGGKIQKTGSSSTSASASSARSAGASTNPRRSATPASPTAPASTPSSRRWRSTGPRSPFVNSRRTSSPSTNWSSSARSRRRAPRSCRSSAASAATC